MRALGVYLRAGFDLGASIISPLWLSFLVRLDRLGSLPGLGGEDLAELVWTSFSVLARH